MISYHFYISILLLPQTKLYFRVSNVFMKIGNGQNCNIFQIYHCRFKSHAIYEWLNFWLLLHSYFRSVLNKISPPLIQDVLKIVKSENCFIVIQGLWCESFKRLKNTLELPSTWSNWKNSCTRRTILYFCSRWLICSDLRILGCIFIKKYCLTSEKIW